MKEGKTVALELGEIAYQRQRLTLPTHVETEMFLLSESTGYFSRTGRIPLLVVDWS